MSVHHPAYARYVVNYRGSEDVLIYLPRVGNVAGRMRVGNVAGRIPIVYAHGFGGSSGSEAYKNIAQAADDLRPLAGLGHPVAVPDLSGVSTWGNDDSWDALDDTVVWMGTNLGTRTDKVGLVGESMGALTVLNWAWRNPTKPAAIWLRVPVVNLAAFKTRNEVSFGATIESAYGGAGPYATALPTHDPSHANNHPVLAGFRDRAHMWGTLGDEFIPVSELTVFSGLVGWPLTMYPGNHSIGFGTPPEETAAFMVTNLDRFG
jgi:pimeloyl-ACP methyl ester carboxylesterase